MSYDLLFNARVRFYANISRVTHRVMLDGQCIGHLYDNGAIVIDDPGPDDQPPAAALPLLEAA